MSEANRDFNLDRILLKILPSYNPQSPQRWMILALILLTTVTFHNCLQNDFIGDDKVLFIRNEFYHSLKNFPKIFERELVMDPQNAKISSKYTSLSGIISYRPVPAATFFVDYAIWKENPFGHHLTNIILHSITVVLLLFFVFYLTGNVSVAFLAAMLFAVHPIQSETVNCIGYRSDLLMAMFFLGGLSAYHQWKQTARRRWLLLTAGCYIFALFSKESAIMFLPIVALFDMLIDRGFKWTRIFKESLFVYILLLSITAVYLYIYLFVMPNNFYPRFIDNGQGLLIKAVVVLKIFANYLLVLVIPTKVSVLPPLYAPALWPLRLWEIFLPIFILLCALGYSLFNWQRHRVVVFSILWFLFNYFPISNIVPLLNPFAFRFMYLPSIGFFIVAAMVIDHLLNRIESKNLTVNIKRLSIVTLVGLNSAMTISNNGFFKNDFVACHEMVNRYPDAARPYWILGLEYYVAGNPREAQKYLIQYLRKSINNPFISDDKEKFMTYHLLGKSTLNPDQAIGYLKKARDLFPEMAVVYSDMAWHYMIKKDYATAIEQTRQAIARDPKDGYAYLELIHCYMEMKDWQNAHMVLKQAKEILGDDINLKIIENYLTRKERGR